MIKRIIAPLAILVILFGAAFAVGHHDATAIQPVHPPKMELVSFSSCPLGQGCIYTDVNGGGSVYHVIFSQVQGCTELNGIFDHTMSSSIETIGSGWHFKFFSGHGCTNAGSLYSPFVQPDDTSADWSAGFGVHNDLAAAFELIR